MRSRWFHAPEFHVGNESFHKKVTWLELFYDLIFVAAFIQLGNGLSHHISWQGVLAFIALFTPMWIAWTGYAFYVNRFTVDDFLHRTLVLAKMLCVGGMAVAGPFVFRGDPRWFAMFYAIVQSIIAVLYYRSWKQVPLGKDFSRYWGTVYFLGAVVWAISCFLPNTLAYCFWGIGVAITMGSPMVKQSRALAQQYPIDWTHLSERFGLLTLIVLGESFVKVLTLLSSQASDFYIIGQASMMLLITCCLWWVYFDDVAESKLRKKPLSLFIWFYAHLPLQLGVTAVGVAIYKAVTFDLMAPAPTKYRWFLCGCLALIFISVALIDSVTERKDAKISDKHRINARYASAFFVLLLAPIGGSMTALLFVAIVMAVCCAQVIFDMMMVPFEEAPNQDSKVELISDKARESIGKGSQYKSKTKNRDIREAIQRGAPSELRRDLYYYFVEGSWKRIFGVMGFFFVAINIVFAGLYLLVPGSIHAAKPDSFSDAFFFSVQTMSTIGYGGMTPSTLYGNIIVTIEAAIGLISVALATGVMFAKASRPKASVLFSNVVTVFKRHGKQNVVFRAGNARGTEIVDATINVSVIVEELTPEGEHIRRIKEVELVRKNSPLFALSWTVMHEINEKSPFSGVDWSVDEDLPILMMIVVLVGYDGTYGQTIYSRKVYYPEDFRRNERLVDVFGEHEDGRTIIDYEKFHDTVKVAE